MMIRDLVNQIKVFEVIPVECVLSSIVNCYKRKRNIFERNYSGLKLTDSVLKIVE